MPVVERIAGPGITPNDIQLEMPSCVRIQTEADNEAFKKFADIIVRQALRHASDTLRAMLGSACEEHRPSYRDRCSACVSTRANAAKLADEFSSRLGL